MIETFQASVKEQINGNKEHGWGGKDSMAVIAACIKAESGKDASKEILEAISLVVNPSAFRQTLEKQGMLNKGGEKARVKSAFAQFE